MRVDATRLFKVGRSPRNWPRASGDPASPDTPFHRTFSSSFFSCSRSGFRAVSERFQSGFRAVASTDGYPMIPKHLRDSWRGANNGQVNPEKTGRWRERLQVKRDPELSTDGCQRHRIPKNVQESQKESLKMATGPFLPYPHDLSSSSSSSSSSFSGSPPPPPPPPFWCCGQATNRLVFIWCKVDQFCTSLSLSLSSVASSFQLQRAKTNANRLQKFNLQSAPDFMH